MQIVFFNEPGYEGNKVFEPCQNNYNRPFVALKQQLEAAGHEVLTFPVEGVDFQKAIGIYFDMPRDGAAPLCFRSLLVMLEPPCVAPREYERLHGLPFTRILTFKRDLCDNQRVFYSPFPIPRYDRPIEGKHDKYICAISGNKRFDHPEALYDARRQAYLSWGKDIDVYGIGWHTDQELMDRCNYLGPCEDKIQTLSKYKYALVFENQVIDGYNSEKYYDCLVAGTVPLYRGGAAPLPIEEVYEDKWAERIVKHVGEIV